MLLCQQRIVNERELKENMRITDEEKKEIIAMWKSGKYYNVEIADWLGISITSVGRIIREYHNGQDKN